MLIVIVWDKETSFVAGNSVSSMQAVTLHLATIDPHILPLSLT